MQAPYLLIKATNSAMFLSEMSIENETDVFPRSLVFSNIQLLIKIHGQLYYKECGISHTCFALWNVLFIGGCSVVAVIISVFKPYWNQTYTVG